jgi:hypothetical protein
LILFHQDIPVDTFVGGGSDLLLLVKIEPGAGSVVESAGRERFVPFSCVLDILFLILVGADRLLDDI